MLEQRSHAPEVVFRRATYPADEELQFSLFEEGIHRSVCQRIDRTAEEVENPDDGRYLFTRSGINAKDKVTRNAYSCLGIILAGVSNKTEANVSVMVHVTPGGFHPDSQFKEEHGKLLAAFAERTLPHSRVGIIAGGDFTLSPFAERFANPFDSKRYPNARASVASLHRRFLGIDTLAVPPKNGRHFGQATNLFFDNEHRSLYILESERLIQNVDPQFSVPEIKRLKGIWKL